MTTTCPHGWPDACPECIGEVATLKRRSQHQRRLIDQCKAVIDAQRGFIETCHRHRDAYRELADRDRHQAKLEVLDREVYGGPKP